MAEGAKMTNDDTQVIFTYTLTIEGLKEMVQYMDEDVEVNLDSLDLKVLNQELNDVVNDVIGSYIDNVITA